MVARNARRSAIRFTYSTPEQSFVKRTFIRSVERIGGQPRLKRLYDRYVDTPDEAKNFFQSAVDLLELRINCDSKRLNDVPSDGPVLFVANHPYGVLDGLVLTWLARRARPEVKVMANHVLCQVPDAEGSLLPVDFSGTPDAARTNLDSRRQALKTLVEGGAVGMFPAGGVAASEKPLKGLAVDSTWHPFTAKLIRMSKATVVPVYFAGQNSRMFQFASHTSYTLRLSLFFWETARRMGSELEVGIGTPIAFSELSHFETRDAMVRELRRRTFALGSDIGLPSDQVPRFDREFAFPQHIRF